MAVAHDALSESHTGSTPSTLENAFSWTHTPAGTPRSVLVFVHTFTQAPSIMEVTYGGVPLVEVPGGVAVGSDGDEPCRCEAYFLGESIPTGAQTVEVSRFFGFSGMYATCFTATAARDTEAAGVQIEQTVGALAEVNVDDGATGVDSLRYAGVTSGLDTVPTTGASSTGDSTTAIDTGTQTAKAVRETTAGQGNRPVGMTGGSDDRAAVYLAIRELLTPPENPSFQMSSVG